jgi:hypothetical protein
VRRLLAIALLAAPLWSSAAPAAAQCSMCKTALTNSAEGRSLGEEFNRAILVMLFAPYAVFGTVGAVLMRRRIGAALSRSARRVRRVVRAARPPRPRPRLRVH